MAEPRASALGGLVIDLAWYHGVRVLILTWPGSIGLAADTIVVTETLFLFRCDHVGRLGVCRGASQS